MNVSFSSHVFQPATDEEILSTRDVMCELRPHIPEEQYLPAIRRMMAVDGYHLAAVRVDQTVRAVAGYRFMEKLSSGKIMYVDDLGTAARFRSQGCGKTLLDWLKTEAKVQGCAQLHLDSGVQREAAHRFYFREGLTINCHHFRVVL